jgi:hypothetical protein
MKKTFASSLYVLGILLLLSGALLTSSCREDFEFTPSTGELAFSKDTLFLDTIFTGISSSTYNFKVYNTSNQDILIPSIRLGQGNGSQYRLNVDGIAGQEFQNIPLLAQDSLFVFVELTLSLPNSSPDFLYTDQIAFGDGIEDQTVELVTLVRDAVFLYPERGEDGSRELIPIGTDSEGNIVALEGFLLEDDELTFTAEKPYVIYGYAAVPEGRDLNVEAGARVYFHNNSGIYVGEDASLQVNGNISADPELKEGAVIFEGDRLEPEWEYQSGQWGGLWLSSESRLNRLNHLILRNASVGIFLEGGGSATTRLELTNSQIHNSQNIGLLMRNSRAQIDNTIVGSAGIYSVYLNLGGHYTFRHSTIANYWTAGFRNTPALLIDNFIDLGEAGVLTGDLDQALFVNSIIDGNRSIEYLLAANPNTAFDYSLDHCLLRFNDFNQLYAGNPLYDFTNSSIYRSLYLNNSTEFTDPALEDFSLQPTSGARERGLDAISALLPLDLKGLTRILPADLGALEFVPD